MIYLPEQLGDTSFLKYNFAVLTKLASRGSRKTKREIEKIFA